ncbi:MAM domain-containing glycosylphosphatidylinositol anchor protein 2-like [Styela clava]
MELVQRFFCYWSCCSQVLLLMGFTKPSLCFGPDFLKTSVYASPKVRIIPATKNKIVLRAGDNVVLTCVTTGHPKPKIQWTIQGGELDRRPLNLYDPILSVSNIQPQEAGKISCKAENGIGSRVFAVTRLIVYYLLKPSMRLYISKSDPVPSHSMWFENTIVLRCATYSNPESAVSWYKDGRPITEAVAAEDGIEMRKLIRYMHGTAVHVLKIRNAGSQHHGNYECLSSLKQNGLKYSIPEKRANFTYNGKIAEPRIVVMNLDKVIANTGDDILLECKVTGGFPQPYVTWIRENEAIPRNHAFVSNRKILQLRQVQANYAGAYYCVANNNVGNPVKTRVDIIVRYLNPMQYWITPDPLSDDKRLTVGKDIKLTCYTEAQPPEELEYLWFKKKGNNALIPVNSRTGTNIHITDIKTDIVKRFLTFPAFSSRLEIRQSSEENYGIYVCRARLVNGKNGTQVQSEIVITQESAPAQLFASDPLVSAREGGMALLECRSKGRPVPKIQWLREGNVTINDNRITIVKNGKLQIRNVSRDDAGTYTCIPTRINGFSKLAKINFQDEVELDVNYPPEVIPSYKVWRRQMGDKLTLTCQKQNAKPDWGISYRWTKEGRSVTETNSQTITISPLKGSNYGVYVCTVSNEVGESQCVINVTGSAYAPEFYYGDEDNMRINGPANSMFSRNISGQGVFVYILSWTQRLPYAVDPITEYRIRWRQWTNNLSTDAQWYQDTKPIQGIGVGELITYEMLDLTAGSYEVEVTPKTDFGYGDTAKRIINARKKRGLQTTLQGSAFFCAFSTNDICGFMQEPSGGDLHDTFLPKDDFDWLWNNENTLAKRTRETGPDFDFTSSKIDGGYMFIESSQVRKGQKARLISPWIRDEDSPQQCLKFHYHMKGRHIGRLRVFMRTTNIEATLWNKTGHQGNNWIPAFVPFYHNMPYKMVFEAHILKPRPQNNQGDIAIDDVLIGKGPCPTPSTPTSDPPQRRTAKSKGNGARSIHYSIISNYIISQYPGFCSFVLFYYFAQFVLSMR